MNRIFLSFLLSFIVPRAFPVSAENAPMVATLHPLMTEMVSRLAGDAVRIEELMGPGDNPHTFDPTPRDLARIQDAVLVVAMGKNLEVYLDRLAAALPATAVLYQAGRLVPSVRIDASREIFMCCPTHSHGAIDPHWWHSPRAMRTAVRHLGRQLEQILPEHRGRIRDNTLLLMDELEALHIWAEQRLSSIPTPRRKLVTSHAAFGYFCEAFRFVSIPVQGLTHEREPSPAYLAETIDLIRKHHILAVFPDAHANPRILERLTAETGTRMGTTLQADNLGQNRMPYAEMIRHNVNAIFTALSPPEPVP